MLHVWSGVIPRNAPKFVVAFTDNPGFSHNKLAIRIWYIQPAIIMTLPRFKRVKAAVASVLHTVEVARLPVLQHGNMKLVVHPRVEHVQTRFNALDHCPHHIVHIWRVRRPPLLNTYVHRVPENVVNRYGHGRRAIAVDFNAAAIFPINMHVHVHWLFAVDAFNRKRSARVHFFVLVRSVV